MRVARALTLLLTIVLLVPLTGAAGSASAATVTRLTLDGDPDLGVHHDGVGPKSTPDVVRHRGELTTDEGAPIAGAELELHRKLVGGEWEVLSVDAVTDEEGRYEFLSRIESNGRYQVVYDGDAVHDPAVSARVRLRAMRDFNAVLVEKRSSAVLKGDINPGWGNKVVRWEKKRCKGCAWKTMDQARAGKDGAWRFRGYYPPAGKTWYYRAVLDGTKKFVTSRSGMLVTTRPGRVPAARAVAR